MGSHDKAWDRTKTTAPERRTAPQNNIAGTTDATETNDCTAMCTANVADRDTRHTLFKAATCECLLKRNALPETRHLGRQLEPDSTDNVPKLYCFIKIIKYCRPEVCYVFKCDKCSLK